MKKYLITAIILVLFISLIMFNPLNIGSGQEEISQKIGFVDLEAVFSVSPLKQQAEEELSQISREMEKELSEKMDEVSPEKQSDILQEYQQRLQNKEQEKIDVILAEINQLISIVAENNNISLVLKSEDVLSGGYDLTAEVIALVTE